MLTGGVLGILAHPEANQHSVLARCPAFVAGSYPRVLFLTYAEVRLGKQDLPVHQRKLGFPSVTIKFESCFHLHLGSASLVL